MSLGLTTAYVMGTDGRFQRALGAPRGLMRRGGGIGDVAGHEPLGVSARTLAGLEPQASPGPASVSGPPHGGLGGARERSLLEEIKRALTEEGGRRWVAIMSALNEAMWAWQDARDAACGVQQYGYAAAVRAGGCPTGPEGQSLADEGQARYDRVMAVRDALAEVYRVYDDFGVRSLDEAAGLAGARRSPPGALGLEPVTIVLLTLGSVVAVIGAASLFAWAMAERQSAENRAAALAVAEDVCEQDPQGAACVAALRAGTEPPKSGFPWGLLIAGGVVAVAANAWLRRPATA